MEKQVRNDLRGPEPGPGEAAEQRFGWPIVARSDTQVSVRTRDRRRPGDGRRSIFDRSDQGHSAVG